MSGLLGFLDHILGGNSPPPVIAPPSAAPAPEDDVHGPEGAQPTAAAQAGILGPQPQAQPTAPPPGAASSDPLHDFRPGFLETLSNVLGTSNNFAQAREIATKRHIDAYNTAIAMRQAQQSMAYGQGIQDPVLRNLYFTNPAAYAEVMKQRIGVHDTGAGVTTTGTGANGTGAVFGSVVSKPGETVGNTAGQVLQRNPESPMAVSPSQSVYDPTSGRIVATAPAAPSVITRKPGDSIDVVDPNGGGGAGAQAPGVSALGAASAPGAPASRGARNNNPLNLTSPPKGMWQGQVGRDGDFATFVSPEAGMAAADRNLVSYAQLHGINTLSGIITRWAPPNQNPTAAYIKGVSQDLGVDPAAPLNLTDPKVRARILTSMQRHFETPDMATPAIGGQAPQPAAAPAGVGGQPHPLAPRPPGLRTVVDAGRPVPLSGAEARQQGLQPGRWVQMPDGTTHLESGLNKEEAKRIGDFSSVVDGLQKVVQMDQRGLALNKSLESRGVRTGPLYSELPFLHGNPFSALAERNNPEFGTLESIHNQQTLAMKPDGIGRIMQSEIPIFRAATIRPENTFEVNQSIARDHAIALAYAQAKATFLQDYAYAHGNLNGADQAWAKAQQDKAAAAQHAQPQPASKPAAQPQRGWRVEPAQ
jgi:hypothetical protein